MLDLELTWYEQVLKMSDVRLCCFILIRDGLDSNIKLFNKIWFYAKIFVGLGCKSFPSLEPVYPPCKPTYGAGIIFSQLMGKKHFRVPFDVFPHQIVPQAEGFMYERTNRQKICDDCLSGEIFLDFPRNLIVQLRIGTMYHASFITTIAEKRWAKGGILPDIAYTVPYFFKIHRTSLNISQFHNAKAQKAPTAKTFKLLSLLSFSKAKLLNHCWVEI